MTSARALRINGTPLATLGRLDAIWDDVDGAPPLKGEDVNVDGRPGVVSSGRLEPDAHSIGVGMILSELDDAGVPGGMPQMKANWRALRDLVLADFNTFTLERDDDQVGGGVATVAATARYAGGLTPQRLAVVAAKVTFNLLLLDGLWYDVNDTTVNVTTAAGGTVTNPGAITTRRMTLTFSGGTGAQKLTNTTTGASLTVTADTTGTPIVVDVEAFTAVQGAANVLADVTDNAQDYWMALAPGDNVFTLTGGGSVAVAFKAAHQ